MTFPRYLVRGMVTGFRTANDSGEMRLSAAICTSNVADAADGAWVEIAPYGDHPSPDGSYTQKFSRLQAARVVKTWNSVTGMAARIFKNLRHGLAGASCPVWDGHPESDKVRWPKAKLLAEITDLRTGNEALEGRIRWTANARPSGPLFPSPLWWHWPPHGTPPAVYPELLESIGLVPTPNIRSVPAWTQNSALYLQSDEEPTTTQNEIMDKKLIIKLLGLGADATDEQIETALKSAGTTANALQTANTARTQAETDLGKVRTDLQTANGQVQTLTGERDQLRTANESLTTANGVLASGVLDIAEKRGAITPAEREGFRSRIVTANTAADALKELQTRKAMNVQSVEINGNRIDLSTANARADALEQAIAKKMKEGDFTRDEAFTRCQADPTLSALFGAMKDPTRQS